MPKKTVIIGGGPAGLYASILCAKRGRTVHLIEESGELGGLLGSFKSVCNATFDLGSHFLRQTGVKEIDEAVFGELDRQPDQWQRMPYLKNGAFFSGKLYQRSPFPNTNHLPQEVYEKGLSEFLAATPPKVEDTRTSEDFLVRTFGRTFADYVYRPTLKKYMGVDFSELAPVAHDYFDSNRIIAFTPEKTRELKKNPLHDARLGFHFSDEGQAGLMNYYPSTGGIGQWTEQLKETALKLNVRISTKTRAEGVRYQDNCVKGITLSNGEVLDVDELVWTAVPVPLLKLCALGFELEKIKLRTSNLYYYLFDRPLQTECYYVLCLDARYQPFRISNYAALHGHPNERQIHACCVEVIGNEADIKQSSLHQVFQELKAMGLLEPKTTVVHQEAKVARAGFPVLTNAFFSQTVALREFLLKNIKNLTLVGKGSGKAFFTQDVLKDVYETIGGFPR